MSTILEVSEYMVRLVDHRKVTIAELPVEVDIDEPIRLKKVQRGFNVSIRHTGYAVPLEFRKVQIVVWTGEPENQPKMEGMN